MKILVVAAACLLAAVAVGLDPEEAVRRPRGLDDGEFLVDTCITLVPMPGDQRSEAVAFDGTNYLALWTDQRLGTDDVFGARVSQDGRILDVDGIPIAVGGGGQSTAAVAFDGSNYLVVYEDYQGSSQIHGIRVSLSGTVLDSTGFVICPGPRVSFPSVACGTANLLVVWQDYRNDTADIFAARVTREGTVLDPDGLALTRRSGDAWTPEVAFDGTNYLVVWYDDRHGYDDVLATRVTSAGAVLDPNGILVCNAANHQRSPFVAYGGGCYLVAWEDRRGASSDIYAARVSPAGTVLDPNGLVLCSVERTQWYPSVAHDGTNFLVGWGDWRGDASVFASRVTSTGTVLDPNGRRISHPTEYADRPKLAFGNAHYLAAWTCGSWNRDIRAARVSTSCTPLDSAGFLVSASVNSQRNPAAAQSGTDFLVVWEDVRTGPGRSIYGARVNQTGTVLDSQAFEVSTAAGVVNRPAAAFDGTNTLVVWEDSRNGPVDIYGARVSAGGEVLDPRGIAIRSGTDIYMAPSVAFDGANYLVVWESYRLGAYSDVYGARVTPAGVVLDTLGIAISATEFSEDHASVAFDGTAFLVAWQDYRNGSADIYGARVSGEGLVLDTAGIAISTASGGQGLPVAVSDGANTLVAWVDSRWGGEAYDIYGARVTQDGAVLDPTGIPISRGPGRKLLPTAAFDGADFAVIWQDDRSDTAYDVRGARVTPAGVVVDSFPVVVREGGQRCPVLSRSAGGPVFLGYQGRAGLVGGKTYNADRIWGKINPLSGVARYETPVRRSPAPAPAVVRGQLRMPQGIRASLLDITGRRVMVLLPGRNDIRHVAPGVYFIRGDSGWPGGKGSSVKIVIQR